MKRKWEASGLGSSTPLQRIGARALGIIGSIYIAASLKPVAQSSMMKISIQALQITFKKSALLGLPHKTSGL
jgi:hypothetical protein